MKTISEKEAERLFKEKKISEKDFIQSGLLSNAKVIKPKFLETLIETIRSAGASFKELAIVSRAENKIFRGEVLKMFGKMVEVQEALGKNVNGSTKKEKKKYTFRFERTGDGTIKKVYVNEE